MNEINYIYEAIHRCLAVSGREVVVSEYKEKGIL